MSLELDLTEDELDLVNSVLEPHTLQGLVANWLRVVQSVNSYPFSIYDYDNDVSVRDEIQQAVEACPVHVQVRVWAALREIDEAFIQATVPAERSRFPITAWQRRLPIQPGPDLIADISSGNF